jgi:hypothetical protein
MANSPPSLHRNKSNKATQTARNEEITKTTTSTQKKGAIMNSDNNLMMNFTSPEECAENLDKALDGMLHFDGVEYKAKVCFSCDILLMDSNHTFLTTKRLER